MAAALAIYTARRVDYLAKSAAIFRTQQAISWECLEDFKNALGEIFPSIDILKYRILAEAASNRFFLVATEPMIGRKRFHQVNLCNCRIRESEKEPKESRFRSLRPRPKRLAQDPSHLLMDLVVAYWWDQDLGLIGLIPRRGLHS